MTKEGKNTPVLNAEERVLVAKMTIEKAGRMLNHSVGHDLKVARFIEGNFVIPKRLADAKALEEAFKKIEAGAGYGDMRGKLIALSAITKEKVGEQVKAKLDELSKLPLNDEQKEAVARTMPKYADFLNKYVESEAIKLAKTTFGLELVEAKEAVQAAAKVEAKVENNQ